MEVRYERDAAGLTTLRVELPAERVDALYQEAVKDLRRHINLPGFRRGRVPPKMVQSVLGQEAISEYAAGILKERLLPEALAEVPHLRPLDEPELELGPLVSGQPCEATIRVVAAVVELGPFEGVPVQHYHGEVGREVAEAELRRVYHSNAEAAPADHDEVRDGDTVRIGLQAVHDGVLVMAFGEDRPLRLTIGQNQLVPNLDEYLLGMRVDETKSVPVTYPDDYNREDLRGETLEVTLEVFAVEVLESLEEFLQRASDFGSVEEAVANLRERMQMEQDNQFHLIARESVVAQVVENSQIDIPRAHLESEIMEAIEEYEEQLEEEGHDLDEIDDDALEAEYQKIRERVEYEHRRELVLLAVAQRLDLKPERDDLINQVAAMASANQVDPRLVVQRLDEDGLMPDVVRTVQVRKAAERLLDLATVSLVDTPGGDLATTGAGASVGGAIPGVGDLVDGEQVDDALDELDEEPMTAEPEDEPCP